MAELRELLRELWAERRRLLLVVVALAWGTLGLTVLLGFGSGFDTAMQAVLRQSGDRMLRVSSGATTLPAAGLPAGRSVTLRPEDAAALQGVRGVARVSVEHAVSARLDVAGRIGQSSRVQGVDAGYADIRGMAVQRDGRFLSPIDLSERRRVIVLGSEIAREHFGSGDPIGRYLRVSGQPFLVVGVLEKRVTVMNYNGPDDNKAFVPATTLRALFGIRYPSYVLIEAERPEASAELVGDLRRTLAARLRFDPGDRGAVSIVDLCAETRRISAIVVGTRLFLMIVGVLGLLVAAVGVGNVMHALVEERIREIGLRLALGARPAQIRARHLLEALLLVAFGGGIGLALATALLMGMNALPMDGNVRGYLGSPVPSTAVAIFVACTLGACAAIAGWHPSRRAASIEPVEALRHE